MSLIPVFPTIVTRAGKGAPLLDSELDANFLNLKSYALTLANLLAGSINPDGTLVPNSVGTEALQAAAVTLANLNPALLYSIIPVDTDTGTVDAYAITARGGLGGTNLVPGGAVYDANGNYVINNLTLNYGYYWAKGANDASVIVNDSLTVTTSGACTAAEVNVQLTGTPGAAITASLALSAPLSAYKNGQIFFVYTANTNVGPATLNVNNIGAIPILLAGVPLTGGEIAVDSVFCVIYQSGSFILFSGGGSTSTTTNSLNYTINGTTLFSSGNLAIPGPGNTIQAAHGFGAIPTSVQVMLLKIAADATIAAVGEYVSADQFRMSATLTNNAFTIGFDSQNIYVVQANDIPALEGVAITPGSWQLIINGLHQTTITNIVFPELSYQISCPEGAYSYGTTMLIFSYGQSQTYMYGTAINMANNEIVATLGLPGGNSGTGIRQNHSLWIRANGVLQSIFTANSGVYTMPALYPLLSLIPTGVLYSAAGTYQVTINAGTAYTLTKGTNDLQYSLDGSTFVNLTGTPALIPASNTYTTLTLKGNPNGYVTATLTTTTGGSWQATQLWGSVVAGYHNYKPVWFTESGGSITGVYVAPSGYNANQRISNIPLYLLTNTGVTLSGTTLDLTNTGISNITQFRGWYPTGSGARVMLFQYNPISKRIYVITNEIGLIHIFQITGNYGANGVTNDISAFWADTTGRYNNLKYVKSLAISGTGDTWGNSDRDHFTIEVDMTSGLEKAITYVREGNTTTVGSVSRVPWVEQPA